MASRAPLPIRAIEVMGGIGIAFWVVTIVRSLIDDAAGSLGVVIVGVVLGGAHLVVALAAHRRSIAYVYAIAFIFIGDLALAIWVDPQAFALVAFTVVLGILAATPSARAWTRAASQG
jgi:hypothetical protein